MKTTRFPFIWYQSFRRKGQIRKRFIVDYSCNIQKDREKQGGIVNGSEGKSNLILKSCI